MDTQLLEPVELTPEAIAIAIAPVLDRWGISEA